MIDQPESNELLVRHLARKFRVRSRDRLLEKLVKEASYREHRFDYIGKTLYELYYRISKSLFDGKPPESFPPGAILSNGGKLDDIENELRKSYRPYFEQQIDIVKQMVLVEWGSIIEDLDPIEIKVRDKNLDAFREIFANIKDEEARNDPYYALSMRVLAESRTASATLILMSYLFYLVNVYNIVLSDHEASLLAVGRADIEMTENLSDSSLAFLDGLEEP